MNAIDWYDKHYIVLDNVCAFQEILIIVHKENVITCTGIYT